MPNTQSELFKIFVFGTLKEGFPNYYLNQGIRQDGEYATEKNYLFYLVGERYTPCIFSKDNQGESIIGELYSVNQDQLDILDKLERTDEADGYRRTLININNLESKQKVKAFIYLKMAHQIEEDTLKIGPINVYTLEHATFYQYRKKDS